MMLLTLGKSCWSALLGAYALPLSRPHHRRTAWCCNKPKTRPRKCRRTVDMLEVALTRLAVSLGALGEMNGDDAGGEQLNCSFVGREQGDVISKKNPR